MNRDKDWRDSQVGKVLALQDEDMSSSSRTHGK